MARNTWTGAEDGTRRTAPYHYAALERALQREPGSIEKILAGGEPQELVESTELTEPPTDPELALILDAPVDARTKKRMIEYLERLREQDAKRRAEIIRMMLDQEAS